MGNPWDWMNDPSIRGAEREYYLDNGERPPGFYYTNDSISAAINRANLSLEAGHYPRDFVDPPKGYPGGMRYSSPYLGDSIMDYIRYMYEMNPQYLRNLFNPR